MSCGHWIVRESAANGFWLAECVAHILTEDGVRRCGNKQEIRLNDATSYVPQCKCCGARSPDVIVREVRARFFARAKRLPRGV